MQSEHRTVYLDNKATIFIENIGHVVIYKAFYLDVAQGHTKGAPNETRTHSCMFSSRAYVPNNDC